MKGSAAAVKMIVLALYMIAGPSSWRTAVEIVGGAGHDVARAMGVVEAGETGVRDWRRGRCAGQTRSRARRR